MYLNLQISKLQIQLETMRQATIDHHEILYDSDELDDIEESDDAIDDSDIEESDAETNSEEMIWFRSNRIGEMEISAKSIQIKTTVKCCIDESNNDYMGTSDEYIWYSSHTETILAEGADIYLEIEKRFGEDKTEYWIYLHVMLDEGISAMEVEWNTNVTWAAAAGEKRTFTEHNKHCFVKTDLETGWGVNLSSRPGNTSELDIIVDILSWRVNS